MAEFRRFVHRYELLYYITLAGRFGYYYFLIIFKIHGNYPVTEPEHRINIVLKYYNPHPCGSLKSPLSFSRKVETAVEIPVGQRPESHFRYLTLSMYTQLYELTYKAIKAKCT